MLQMAIKYEDPIFSDHYGHFIRKTLHTLESKFVLVFFLNEFIDFFFK